MREWSRLTRLLGRRRTSLRRPVQALAVSSVVLFMGQLGLRCAPGDDNAADRRLCQQTSARCILVHQVDGANRLELFEGGRLVDSVTVNTGRQGSRTRNGTGRSIYDETFSTESSESVTRASYGTDPKQWAPGVRQVFDGRATGLMGDPHRFDGGQAFHWRVAYSGELDENGKSIPVLRNGLAQERQEYHGGYASNGCVHVPKWFLDNYDATFFQRGVAVRIQDQPTS